MVAALTRMIDNANNQ